MNETAAAPLLSARRLGKSFPGVVALDGVDLEIREGEVLGVIGENGAGKSTLMKILAGVQPPDRGTLEVGGRPVRIDTVRDALDLGIALMHQELNLAGNLDVASNVFLGREPHGKLGIIDGARMRREAKAVTDRIGLDSSPRARVERLSTGRQQMVEIAKALSVDARIIIMDEPTSSLSTGESQNLFRVIKELRTQGVSIVYVSHRLSEVQTLCDRVVVLRDGRIAGELAKSQIDHGSMVQLMVGRDVSGFYVRSPHDAGDRVLEVDGVRTPAFPDHALSFEVRAGEVVGVAGLVGAGRTELVQTLFGVTRPLAGQVRIDGRAVRLRSPTDAIAAGLGLVPEDRKQQGLVIEMSVRDNVGLVCLQHDARFGLRDSRKERARSRDMVERLQIKTPTDRQLTRHLSGGNQQKVVLGKWLATEPKLLVLDEPTRGIDVGAKAEIYALMDRLAADGVAVLFVSSEMEEILGIADRVLVMHEGQLKGELSRDQLSEVAVMHLATGGGSAA
ncbi:MAG: D-xylose ABC transporter ATP-binding protein [Phycisphaeraceae bacterium]|nr:D-xylose ABC transporter ATP-binding protein [Phycisphaeraceae bacterium]